MLCSLTSTLTVSWLEDGVLRGSSFYRLTMLCLPGSNLMNEFEFGTLCCVIFCPSATLWSEVVTFSVSFRVWWPESSEEHGPTSILEVLRLRARDPLLSDRAARRFAQDDGLVRVLKQQSVGRDKNAENQKSHDLSG